MKKLLGIIVLGLLWCNNGFAGELTGTETISQLLDKGYKIINEDSSKATLYMKHFTLRKKSSLVICTVRINTNGSSRHAKCKEV
jgi:hypothetical protein|tara:strand:- start:391 stop:642 length:252 start_codon:yes stop_codon:yes gene_type:complete